MNYPKMLYKGEKRYSSNEELKSFLSDKSFKTVIVSSENQEKEQRNNGFVDLHELIVKPKEKLTLPEKNNVSLNAS